ncbi:hypothetical protein FD724_06865 [Nostoc sp. C057]|uniref:hypothetical protein n=1 Tax=Nostoc sp. C057 TaxID=2576903 RepID=UPI0015C30B9E|nr:hypothetical protein [Nostoc sp. C057]QLE47859.1 hypothetical protein FD724_06865 [Nostoc sp. C057]
MALLSLLCLQAVQDNPSKFGQNIHFWVSRFALAQNTIRLILSICSPFVSSWAGGEGNADFVW